MAYPSNCVGAQTVVDVATRDTNRLVGSVSQYIAQKSPYADTIDGGTIENVSEDVRSAVMEQAMPAASMVRPTFINATAACGTAGGVDQVGITEFTYRLKNFRGRGPLICVKSTRTAFKSAYSAAVAALKSNLLAITNADIRANYLDNSGGKLTMDSTATFDQAYAGAINSVGTAWANRTPDSGPSFRSIEYLMTFMRETLAVNPYEGESGDGVFKAIFGMDVIQGFRDELDVREDLRYLTAGRYRMGEETIKGYTFSGPYHGMVFGTDPRPLRASAVVAGVPTLVEPLVATQTSNGGYAGRPNPSWTGAPYEIGFVMGQSSFRRLVPEYAKVAGWDFSEQLVNGGLRFKILSDADCNLWEDYGQHLYEIERAYEPLAPHAVTAILYKRCTASLNLVAC